jgi:methanogenic corrinoid protein MtbC1
VLASGAQALLEGASSFDEGEITRLIEGHVAEGGWAGTLSSVLFPALVEVGRAWERGELSLAHEHFLSSLIARALHCAIAAVPPPLLNARRLLIACPDGEQHDLSLLALALLLRTRGARCFYLGAAVPPADIVAAVEGTRSDIVCMSAVTPTSLPHVGLTGRALIAARSRARLFVGGPAVYGIPESLDVPGVRLPATLTEAADVLMQAPLSPRR